MSFTTTTTFLRTLSLFTTPKPSFILHSLRPLTTLPTPPTPPTTTLLTTLRNRGLLENTTSSILPSTPLTIYCGFDPTAESLHIGNLLAIIVLTWFKTHNHIPIAVVGGATGRVGDPSGKSTERPLLSEDTLRNNTASISGIIKKLLGENVRILDNLDWWGGMGLLDFLRDVGKFARVGVMLGKESVRRRLEGSGDGLSYTEFTYQLLQAYDFVHLFRNEGVRVQIGGSDQWGNITAGTDLIRRLCGTDEVYGLTFPLLLKSDGSKFGKSEDGAIWLSPKLLSPYKFYQYFFSVPDADVIRFLKVLTFLSLEEIGEIEVGMKSEGYVQNSAQRRLAEEVTRFVHGEEGLEEAIKATEALRPGAETRLDLETINGIAKDVPSCSLPYDQVLGSGVVEILVSTRLVESKSAARRLLRQGGLYLNNGRVDSEGRKIEADDIVEGKILLLSAGKKNKMVVRIS